MDLFIIGNGFDIAHGLPTKYDNFREYLDQEYWDFLIELEKLYDCKPNGKKWSKEWLWQDFEKNLAEINDTAVIEWGASIEMGLEGGDIDVFDPLEDYFNDMYSYIESLRSYLKQWVEQIELKTEKRTKRIDCRTKDQYLSFNYTLLLEKIYGIENEQILHIHGSIDQENEFSPDIGHGDINKIKEAKEKSITALDESEDKEAAILSAVAKYYDRSLKDVPYYLVTHNSFFKQLSEIEEVFVIGHSLGEVDLPYFRKIWANIPENTFWNIYYFYETERAQFEDVIVKLGINRKKCTVKHSSEFYGLA